MSLWCVIWVQYMANAYIYLPWKLCCVSASEFILESIPNKQLSEYYMKSNRPTWHYGQLLPVYIVYFGVCKLPWLLWAQLPGLQGCIAVFWSSWSQCSVSWSSVVLPIFWYSGVMYSIFRPSGVLNAYLLTLGFLVFWLPYTLFLWSYAWFPDLLVAQSFLYWSP